MKDVIIIFPKEFNFENSIVSVSPERATLEYIRTDFNIEGYVTEYHDKNAGVVRAIMKLDVYLKGGYYFWVPPIGFNMPPFKRIVNCFCCDSCFIEGEPPTYPDLP